MVTTLNLFYVGPVSLEPFCRYRHILIHCRVNSEWSQDYRSIQTLGPRPQDFIHSSNHHSTCVDHSQEKNCFAKKLLLNKTWYMLIAQIVGSVSQLRSAFWPFISDALWSRSQIQFHATVMCFLRRCDCHGPATVDIRNCCVSSLWLMTLPLYLRQADKRQQPHYRVSAATLIWC